jgi:hypothetical protein
LWSVREALSYYTDQFGPYPYRHINLAEFPGYGGMHAEASLITFQEGFSLFNQEGSPRSPDGGRTRGRAPVVGQSARTRECRDRGNSLLSETLAEYSAYQVVKKTFGQDRLRRIGLNERRAEEETPGTRTAAPLLRATTHLLAYRKGGLAMYALSEYIGEERVNEALRRLLAQHDSGALLTSLDLYRDLQAVTPDSLHYLLHDLFEANTFWLLETERATAKETDSGAWQVTLDVRARKVVVDSAGVETKVPMDDWVEIGVFAPAEEGDEELSKPLYVQKHRIRSGEQTITVTVPHKPARAGIDPHYLLFDLEMDNNIEAVKTEN